MTRTALVLLACMLLPPPVTPLTQTTAPELLRAVRSLKCDFPEGYIVNLATIPIERDTATGPLVVYDAIDRVQKTARIGTVGPADMGLIVGTNTLTFVELVPTGTPMVTVVYGQFRRGTREFLAVTSRHFGHLGVDMPIVTVGQYYGTCRVLR